MSDWKVQLIQGDPHYNAYERDIAVVNIFFGESTVFGDKLKVSENFATFPLQSLKGPKRWRGLIFSQASEVFVDSALEWAQYPSLSLSTGSPSDLVKILQIEIEIFGDFLKFKHTNLYALYSIIFQGWHLCTLWK